MTAAPQDFDGFDLTGEDRASGGSMRWGGSLLVALGVHAAAGLAMVVWHVPVMPADADPPAVMLELAPLPVAPPEPPPPIDIPLPEPMPEPIIEPPPEPPPEPVIEEEPPPEPPPVVEPEVVIPKPPPKPKVEKPKVEKPKPPKPTPPQPAQVAPPQPAPPAPVAAAPAPSAAPSRAVPSWQGRVLSHLERNKRYPRAAQARRQEGVAQVRFTIDREGRVLSVRLDRSSGFTMLDEETVEMVQRASPLPAPPEEMNQDRIELVVPVQFFLK